MSWNDSGNGKDPWKREDEEPNDLDQIVQNWQRKLTSITGGRRGTGGPNASGGWVLVMLLVIAWAFTGLYRVDEAERGIVQRFGAYTVTTLPGLHWHFPFPIEKVDIVNTNAVDTYNFSTEILTADERYLNVEMVVQFRREDPVDYSFNVVNPEETLEDVTESALREIVGTSTLIGLVSERRDEIAPRTRTILQNTLDSYGAGITVTSLNLETLDYPRAVADAVDDTQKARNDKERYGLEADKYAQDLIPRARGRAARIIQDAEAYRDRVIADAEGEAARFTALLEEYQKAPRVTRDRLYIEAVEEVYANSNKVILDSQGSGNLLYLPIDRLIDSRQTAALPSDRATTVPTPEEDTLADSESAQDARRRRIRQ